MKKFNLVALVLVALSAFLAVAVASASAENLLWLVNGADFEGTLTAETEGDLILVRLASAGGAVQNKILCEGILDGSITNLAGQEGSDEVTKVLNIVQEEVTEDSNLSGLALECSVLEDPTSTLAACKAGGIALVWPANLPWLTLLELMVGPPLQWLNLLLKDAEDSNTSPPGYEVECESLLSGVRGSELCEGNTSGLVLEELEIFLEGETILGSHIEFNWAEPILSEIGSCGTTAGVAALEGLGVTWAVEGELNRLETDVSETTP
jgi:hypothetical protein